KDIKTLSINPKAEEKTEKMSSELFETKEYVFLEESTPQQVYEGKKKTGMPTSDTDIICKTKKIIRRIPKPKESEIDHERAEKVTETKESVQFKSSEIQPVPTEDEPTEMPTPIETEVISKTKKIKKRISKP